MPTSRRGEYSRISRRDDAPSVRGDGLDAASLPDWRRISRAFLAYLDGLGLKIFRMALAARPAAIRWDTMMPGDAC